MTALGLWGRHDDGTARYGIVGDSGENRPTSVSI